MALHSGVAQFAQVVVRQFVGTDFIKQEITIIYEFWIFIPSSIR
jgi:hypothetical protein